MNIEATHNITWSELNEKLRGKGITEKKCLELIRAEQEGPKRTNFLLRIHSRFNVLRAQRERMEIAQGKTITLAAH